MTDLRQKLCYSTDREDSKKERLKKKGITMHESEEENWREIPTQKEENRRGRGIQKTREKRGMTQNKVLVKKKIVCVWRYKTIYINIR